MGIGAADAEFVSELDLVIFEALVRENHFAQWSARKSFRALESAKIISRSGVRENHFAQWSARKSFRALESAKIISRSRAVIGRRE